MMRCLLAAAGTAAQTASGDWHSALWDESGITDLGNFGDDPFGCAWAINNRGQIVGFSGVDYIDVSTAHALLWENGTMNNLQDQIPADSGWVLRQALGINDQGQIAGFGVHEGKIRAFLLTPTVAPQANGTDSTEPDAFAAKAATNPQQLWPARAKVSLIPFYSNTVSPYAFLSISWPSAPLADHYRVTQVMVDRKTTGVVLDLSPVYGTSCKGSFPYFDTTVTVTAYSGPDEATAYSESIKARQQGIDLP